MGASNWTYYKLANPATLPTGIGTGVAFSHNSTYLAVSHQTSPNVTIYKMGASNGTYYKLADPAILPIGIGWDVAFSHNSTYMTVVHSTSPYVSIYKMGASNGTYYKIADPATLTTGYGRGVTFSHDSTYMAIAHNTDPYVSIYKMGASNGTYYKLANPATLPTDDGRSVAFSHNSTYLTIGHVSSPSVTIYKLSYQTGENFSYNLTGLTQGTLYHYRAFANNSVASATGADKMFLTEPDAPTGFTATTVNHTSIALNWTLGTGRNYTYIERNTVEHWARGTGDNISNDTGTTYVDTGLFPGTTYYYQAWSYSSWIYDSTTLYQWSDANASANASTTSANKYIINKTRAAYSLEISLDGDMLYGYVKNTEVQTSIDTQWHYVTLTYDGSTLSLYKDGELKTATSLTGVIPTTSASLSLVNSSLEILMKY